MRLLHFRILNNAFQVCIFSIQVEILQDEVKALHALLEEQRKLSTSVQKQRTQSLESFRNDLESKKESVEQMRAASSTTAGILEIMFSEIGNIFSLFKRSSPSIIYLLGKTELYLLDIHVTNG